MNLQQLFLFKIIHGQFGLCILRLNSISTICKDELAIHAVFSFRKSYQHGFQKLCPCGTGKSMFLCPSSQCICHFFLEIPIIESASSFNPERSIESGSSSCSSDSFADAAFSCSCFGFPGVSSGLVCNSCSTFSVFFSDVFSGF